MRPRRGRAAVPPDYYGFDHVDLVVGHADFDSGHYYRWLVEQGVDLRELAGPHNALQPFEPTTRTNTWRTAVPPELYSTHYVSMRTAAFLDALAEDDPPFLAVCSYPDPHHPFTPPGRYYEMYEGADVPLPETFELTGAPEYNGMQGRSLAPVLAEPNAEVRDHVLVEEDEQADMIGAGAPLRMRSLVTGEARLSVYRGSERGALYDLARDPLETRNLFSRSEGAALKADMMHRLSQSMMQHAEDSPKPRANA